MQALSGNLPVNQKYTLIDISHGEHTTCDNCGMIISNIAELETEAGKKYYTGVDCAEALTACNCIDFWDMKQKKKEFNRTMTFIRKYKKAKKENKVKIEGIFVVFYGDDKIWNSKYRIEYARDILKIAKIII
jgi:hypothetical protein